MSTESIEARFAKFNASPDIAHVTNRYGDWVLSSEGIGISARLSMFSFLRASQKMPRPQYRRAVRDLASTATIPLCDFYIIAKWHLELVRSGLAGTGQIPFTPSEWDTEEDEA